jgi:hypothetical protein
MKHAVLALLALALLAPCLADTTWVTVGSPVTANSIPFWGNGYDAMRFQTLYLQSEINQPGEIVAIGWMTYTDAPSPFYDVRVSLGHTGLAALGDTFAKNYGGNQPQLMFQKDTLVVGNPNDWYYFPCLFSYNNADNLLLEIQWRGDAGQTVRFQRNANTGNPRRAWCSNNDTAAVGQTDAVQGYYARIGFVPTGVGELREVPARAALRVEPTLGRSRFAIRLDAPALELRVVDIAGRPVADLAPGAAEWNAASVPAGVYVIQARTARELLRQQVVVTD